MPLCQQQYHQVPLCRCPVAESRSADYAGYAGFGIDEVRDRAKLGALPTSVRSNKNVLLNALLKERRLELAFEGQRWFDLVRLDKVEEVMNAVYAKDSGRKAQIYTFDKNSYRLPIPQSVIDANDKIHQNPGY